MHHRKLWLLAASLIVAQPLAAQNGSTNISGLINIFKAGGNAGAGDGNLPSAITLNAGTGRVLTFSQITGLWGCQASQTFSADGFDAGGNICVGQANINSSGNIAGIQTSGRSMTLVGLFLGPSLPAAAPARLTYTAGDMTLAAYTGIGLGQVFFIGDGRTTNVLGNGAQGGTVQQFLVPDGATRLFLGVADGCGFLVDPACYNDNSGSLSVFYDISPLQTTVPEPSSVALMAMGLGAVGLVVKRRRSH